MEVSPGSITLTPPKAHVSHVGCGQAALTFPPSIPQALHLGELAQQATVIGLGDTKGAHVTLSPTVPLAAEMGTPRRDWGQV